MTADSLQKLLAVLNEAADVPDEDKQAAAQALASDFAEDVPDDDPAVDDAIGDAGMSDNYAAATDDDKKELRSKFAKLLTRQRAKAFAAVKSTPAAPAKDTPLTLAALQAELPKMLLKALPPAGRVATVAANPTNPGGKTGFSAKIQSIKVAANVSDAKALLMARNADPKGYNEWVKAGKPA